MAKSREDNYRVEVWDREGGTLVETVSRCADFKVSLGAWHAALRRRPGMLLVHINNDHVMEKLVAPGEPKTDAAAIRDELDAALRDLRKWHSLRAWCVSCSHHATINLAQLKHRFGPDVFLSTIEQKLRCTKCRKGPVRLEVHNAPVIDGPGSPKAG